MTDFGIRRVGFLLESIPARGDFAKLLTRETDRLMDDAELVRPLLVQDCSYEIVHTVEVVVREMISNQLP